MIGTGASPEFSALEAARFGDDGAERVVADSTMRCRMERGAASVENVSKSRR